MTMRWIEPIAARDRLWSPLRRLLLCTTAGIALLWGANGLNAEPADVGELLAQCQDEAGGPERRLSACSAIIDLMTLDQDMRIEALMNRGIIREGQGDTEPAIQDYSLIISLDPTNALAHYNRANVLGRLGRIEQALSDYDKAIELDPKDADFYTNRGLSRAEIGDHQRALEDYNRAIGLGAREASIFTARGISNEKLGRVADARSDYRKALELGDDEDEAQDGLERLSSR